MGTVSVQIEVRLYVLGGETPNGATTELGVVDIDASVNEARYQLGLGLFLQTMYVLITSRYRISLI